MDAVAQTRHRGIMARLRDRAPRAAEPDRRAAARDALGLSRAFAVTVLRFLVHVLPQVSGELSHWRKRAAEIPDPQLRRTALQALDKRGNVEGATLLATLAPARARRQAVRCLASFQMAYDYLDALSEMPSDDPAANGYRLHQALLLLPQPDGTEAECRGSVCFPDDGGYLAAMLARCGQAASRLPSYRLVAPIVSRAAARIVAFQTLNLAHAQGGHGALELWAGEANPVPGELEWWELAAAAGSSLAVYALIAAAARPDLDPSTVRDVDAAYFPWICALHSLLDSLVDRQEDRDGGRPCLLDNYLCTADAVTRLATLASRSGEACGRLPCGNAHRVIVTAMSSYYLSASESRTAEGRMVARALRRSLGGQLSLAILMFRSRRLLRLLTGRRYV